MFFIGVSGAEITMVEKRRQVGMGIIPCPPDGVLCFGGTTAR
jgi:hypothetical protein